MAAPHPDLLRFVRGEEFLEGFRISMPMVDSAVEHGLAPLLDDAVRDQAIGGDHDALVALSMRSLACVGSTQAAIKALDRLVDVSESLGIEIALFKGLAIGTRWYPRPELRPFVDIDVFANPNHTHRLGDLIEALDPDRDSRAAVESMVAEGRVFEYSLVVEGVMIDLHVDPVNLVVPTRRTDLMWQRTESISFGGTGEVRALDLELSVLQALFHLFRDNFADLLHILDVGQMIDARPDWDFVASFAEAEGWTDLVRFSLGYVCGVLGRPSPLPRSVSRSGQILLNTVWPDRVRLKGQDSWTRSFRRELFASYLVAGRRRDVTHAMVRRFFPPRYVIDDRYPGCDCPYPVALLRWRWSQRAEIQAARRSVRSPLPGNPELGRTRDHHDSTP